MDNLKIIRHGGYFNLNLIRIILRDKSKSNSVRLKQIRKLFMSLPSEIFFFSFFGCVRVVVVAFVSQLKFI